MRAKWRGLAAGGLLLLALSGCRTVPPELKPAKSEEVLAVPPLEDRYSRSVYPKQAFQDRESDLMRRNDEESNVRPARGSMMSPGGLGGYR